MLPKENRSPQKKRYRSRHGNGQEDEQLEQRELVERLRQERRGRKVVYGRATIAVLAEVGRIAAVSMASGWSFVGAVTRPWLPQRRSLPRLVKATLPSFLTYRSNLFTCAVERTHSGAGSELSKWRTNRDDG